MENRIYGLFWGQLCGDAFGTRYEFMTKQQVKKQLLIDENKNKFVDILGGGSFNVKQGQYTDDSELALGLYEVILRDYNIQNVSKMFFDWFNSKPFDCGNATKNAFQNGTSANKMQLNAEKYNSESLSNGCLMKISPVALLSLISKKNILESAEEICRLTNSHVVCIDICKSYVFAISIALKTGNPIMTYEAAKYICEIPYTEIILNDAKNTNMFVKILEKNDKNEFKTIETDSEYQGFISISFQNAFYQLLHVKPENGGFYKVILNTVKLGGDTDTNACIAGALYGACYGMSNIPNEWITKIKQFSNDEKRITLYPPLKHMQIYNKLIQCVKK